jgi:aldose 1-epimerase
MKMLHGFRGWCALLLALPVLALLLGYVSSTFEPPATAQTAVALNAQKIAQRKFGQIADGRVAELYTLKNKRGTEVSITNFGATVVSIRTADGGGNFADILLGYDDAAAYEAGTAHFGGTIGRYANRIAHGQFKLNGVTYTLAKNNGENTLHGGLRGFDKMMWQAKDISGDGPPSLQMDYLSQDMEEGFPGNLQVRVVFTLTDDNELKVVYSATTDKKTVINLTNHAYFNLHGNGTILQEQLTLAADKFTPVDAGLIPTGELRPVAGTPFDFREATEVGKRIDGDDEQLKLGHGYDHNWIVNGGGGKKPVLAATVQDPLSGRKLEVWTTEPGIQFYTGNFLDDSIHGKGGAVYIKRSALCLETQHYPDSPNHPKFPTTVLLPGAKFWSETDYKFSAERVGD